MSKSLPTRLTATVLVAGAVFASGGAAAQAVPSAPARLAAVARTAPSRTVVAIVQFKPSVSERAARATIRRHGGKVLSRVPLINGLAVKVTAKQARALKSERGVVNVTLNSRVHSTGIDSGRLAANYPKTINAHKLWQRGITGKGVGVAVIDTGVTGNLPDFMDADGNSRVIANAVTNPRATTAGDGFGHGTHVAGIIAGDSLTRTPSDPLYGRYIGVAPESNVIAVKAADEQGNSTILDVINGIQFVVDHRADLNIRVLNLSLSTDTPQSYRIDPLDAAVEYAWQKGIVVIAASGNRGAVADAVQYAPANDPYVISVGGEDETANLGQGERASWSSVGRTQDGFAKPDVMAPGAHIVSLLAPSSAFATLCPNCIIGGTYFKAGGTSMAAPVVAGATALLLQARPTLTPDQVKALFTATDRPVKGGGSAGVIDVERALLTPTTWTTGANRGLVPNLLIDSLNRSGVDIGRWTRSSWSTATGALAAAWARSSWSCAACATTGSAIDPQRSSWSRSSWSSTNEDASAEQAEYEAAANASEDTGSLDAQPPAADAQVPTDDAAAPADDAAPAPDATATPEATQ